VSSRARPCDRYRWHAKPHPHKPHHRSRHEPGGRDRGGRDGLCRRPPLRPLRRHRRRHYLSLPRRRLRTPLLRSRTLAGSLRRLRPLDRLQRLTTRPRDAGPVAAAARPRLYQAVGPRLRAADRRLRRGRPLLRVRGMRAAASCLGLAAALAGTALLALRLTSPSPCSTR
jgi:hypothetical protein